MKDVSRTSLHALVDALPDTELAAAQRFLEFLCRLEAAAPGPMMREQVQVVGHDRPYSPEHRAAVQKALERVLAGRALPSSGNS